MHVWRSSRASKAPQGDAALSVLSACSAQGYQLSAVSAPVTARAVPRLSSTHLLAQLYRPIAAGHDARATCESPHSLPANFLLHHPSKVTAIAVQDQDGRFAPAQHSHLTSARSLGDAADADPPSVITPDFPRLRSQVVPQHAPSPSNAVLAVRLLERIDRAVTLCM